MSSLGSQRRRTEERASAVGSKLPAKAYFFSDSPDGGVPWRPNRVTRAFTHLCDEVGVAGVRLHDLRHLAATRLLAAGVPVNTVAGRLGHANAATTLNVYGHFLESSDESAGPGSRLCSTAQNEVRRSKLPRIGANAGEIWPYNPSDTRFHCRNAGHPFVVVQRRDASRTKNRRSPV